MNKLKPPWFRHKFRELGTPLFAVLSSKGLAHSTISGHTQSVELMLRDPYHTE